MYYQEEKLINDYHKEQKMSREALHSLIDAAEETELDTLYHILIRFVAEDAIQPDEEEAHRIAQEERVRGEVFSDAEVWS